MVHLGLSARMSELHAAVGLLSLRRIDELVKRGGSSSRSTGAARRVPDRVHEHSARTDEQRELLRALHHRTGPGQPGPVYAASRRAGSRPALLLSARPRADPLRRVAHR